VIVVGAEVNKKGGRDLAVIAYGCRSACHISIWLLRCSDFSPCMFSCSEDVVIDHDPPQS